MAAYKTSEQRYEGGGQVKYLVYRAGQKSRNGNSNERTRVRRLYFPADAHDIRAEAPARLEKRSGRKVHAVSVNYRHEMAAASARRGSTTYDLPAREARRSKVVEVPPDAKDVYLTDNPPEGPRQAVA